MSHLQNYIDELNAFGAHVSPRTIGSLSANRAKDRKVIRENLRCDLSPENLCCDGELSGVALAAKIKRLHGALRELCTIEAKYKK